MDKTRLQHKTKDAHSEDVELLARLGFTDYEAKTYRALARHHPATAYEIAKLTGLPRPNVYSVLRALEEKGAVQPTTERPVRYTPVDPETYFGQIEKNTARLCATMARRFKVRRSQERDLYSWVVRGEDEVRAKTIELIDNARKTVLIKAPDELVDPLLPALKAAGKRGVDVMLVLFTDDIERFRVHSRVRPFKHEGDGQLHGAADVLFTLAADTESVLIASHGRNPTASYARNPAIVYVIQTLLLHEIYLAEIFEDLGPELEKRYGKRLMKLRRKFRPDAMDQLLPDSLVPASHEYTE